MPDKSNNPDRGEPNGSVSDPDNLTTVHDKPTRKETVARPRAQRSQLRAAISSGYKPRPAIEAASLVAKTPVELQVGVSDKKSNDIENLIEKADLLARAGEHERARQLYSQAVRLAPDNSEAWCGLGMLLMKQTPERSRYCLSRALALDPENKLALLLLQTVEEELKGGESATTQALARLKSVQRENLKEKAEQESPEASEKPDKSLVKIGLEEVLAKMGESGQEADPEKVPAGGARFQSAIESGVLKPGRVTPQKDYNFFNRYALLAGGLGFLVFVAVIAFLISRSQAPTEQTIDPATFSYAATISSTGPVVTPTAAPTLGPDEIFAGKLRLEVEHYNRYLGTIKSLIEQQQANKLQWETFRTNFDDLQKQMKEEKKTLDSFGVSVVARLITPYKLLQDLGQMMNNATNYMVSGIRNYEPDDLDEALRQYSRASSQLAEVASQLNQVAPLPGVNTSPLPTSSQSTRNAASGPAILVGSPSPAPINPLPGTAATTEGAASVTANLTPVSTLAP